MKKIFDFDIKEMIIYSTLFSDFSKDFRYINIGESTYLIRYDKTAPDYNIENALFDFLYSKGIYLKKMYGLGYRIDGYKLIVRDTIDYNKCGKKVYKHRMNPKTHLDFEE